jgi:putative flippase GtrA
MRASSQGHMRDLSGTALASLVATGLDALIFSIAAALSGASSDLATAACVAAGALAGGVAHFTICRLWVFQRFDAPLSQSAPRYALMSASAGLLHTGLTTLLANMFALQLAWGISKLLVYLGWTYPLSRYVVFTNPSGPSAS